MSLYRYDRQHRHPWDQRDVRIDAVLRNTIRREYRTGRRSLKLSPLDARLRSFGWVLILGKNTIEVAA